MSVAGPIGGTVPSPERRPISWARLGRLSRAAVSPRFTFLDVPTDGADAVLILGSGRSGTTWLGELLNFRNDFRTIWEPCNTVYSPLPSSVGFRWGEYRHPREPDPAFEALLRQLFEGRARSRWIDAYNTRRLPRRRLVKSIEMTNLSDWVRLRFPDVPVVHIFRHPFAFAESHVALDWPALGAIDAEVRASAPRVIDRLDPATRRRVRALGPPGDLFERLVRRWCIENVLALRRPAASVHSVFYEDLVLDLGAELAKLGPFVGVTFGEDVVERAAEPSLTDFRNRAADRRRRAASPESFVAEWQDRVPLARRSRGLQVLEAFGLDGVYDDDPLPVGHGTGIAVPLPEAG